MLLVVMNPHRIITLGIIEHFTVFQLTVLVLWPAILLFGLALAAPSVLFPASAGSHLQ